MKKNYKYPILVPETIVQSDARYFKYRSLRVIEDPGPVSVRERGIRVFDLRSGKEERQRRDRLTLVSAENVEKVRT